MIKKVFFLLSVILVTAAGTLYWASNQNLSEYLSLSSKKPGLTLQVENQKKLHSYFATSKVFFENKIESPQFSEIVRKSIATLVKKNKKVSHRIVVTTFMPDECGSVANCKALTNTTTMKSDEVLLQFDIFDVKTNNKIDEFTIHTRIKDL